MDELSQARSQYEGATRAATEAQATGMTLPDMLGEALNKKFSTDNPLVANRESLLKDYLGAVTQAPLNVTPTSAGGTAGVVYNPLEQANLIQQYRAAPLSALSTVNYLLGLNQGGIQNVIDATGRAYGAGTTRLLGQADIARNRYQDLFAEMQARQQQEQQQREFEEAQRQFNLSHELAKLQERRLGAGAGTIGTGNYYGNNQMPEPRPKYNPGPPGIFSPMGQWIHTTDGWAPVMD